ncbi:single-stranded DNA-binding protein [Malaciobacter mytili]|uniref:Single-stranded DNA-binding protein n=1 Tax=Malaciobacter mytili LMG 24559 TaxID=1032238 RepID=A0AAX2AE40_9BACT|nr:single-stranded DNA-binding protein [Malaciobacter mytili]AXH15974.1 single-stranded DNA binding protein [Malaciobacter mytili LMG 24559]RXI43530.1 single-stranded DNA-binding protein [Malaciobacter mytili]RXK13673.1 single-stranded DNA-binding protein [Malaciobacter mytili LMG 24559]
MYNKIVMVGNLTRDIELRYLPSGAAIAKSAIATSYKYKTSTGEQKDEVCFLDFNIFGRSAEVANQYLRKGSKVLLEGRLVLEQWTAQDGSNRSKHSLRVDTMKMLDTKSEGVMPQAGADNNYNYDNNMGYSQPSNPSNQYNLSASENDYGQRNNYGGMNANSEHRIPEIDIDEDEIPF